ncbi:MAG TPA: hypothetical protein VFY29_20795 [Terriglobia bacterium]|nr:hypothetical protein [Terriglobia bacterium]
MRKYAAEDERRIRTERLARAWARSGLLDPPQLERMLPELKVGLRRTNLFLRLILFVFGLLIILASVAFVVVVSELNHDDQIAVVCVFAAAGCLALAEALAGSLRLYRFGIEEAGAVGAIGLLMIAAGFAADSFTVAVVGAVAAVAVYLRFGYVYAVIASIVCLAAAPFQIGVPETAARALASCVLAVIFVVARSMKRQAGHDFPGDEYSAIQAVAWAGVYGFLNLHLASFANSVRFLGLGPALSGPAPPAARVFYWFTFGAIWAIPIAGIYLALRSRDRALLDVNLLLALVTLATNKPYLGAERQTWDPILLGLLLIGAAVIIRRWLASGPARERSGFTAERILAGDKRALEILATASVALDSARQASGPAPGPPDHFQGGGGRSGGAGAGGEF